MKSNKRGIRRAQTENKKLSRQRTMAHFWKTSLETLSTRYTKFRTAGWANESPVKHAKYDDLRWFDVILAYRKSRQQLLLAGAKECD